MNISIMKHSNLYKIIYKGTADTLRDITVLQTSGLGELAPSHFEEGKSYIIFNWCSRLTFTVNGDKSMNVVDEVGPPLQVDSEVILCDPVHHSPLESLP